MQRLYNLCTPLENIESRNQSVSYWYNMLRAQKAMDPVLTAVNGVTFMVSRNVWVVRVNKVYAIVSKSP